MAGVLGNERIASLKRYVMALDNLMPHTQVQSQTPSVTTVAPQCERLLGRSAKPEFSFAVLESIKKDCFLQCAYRNYLTGTCTLNNICKDKDFFFVDTREREETRVMLKMHEVTEDPYLFLCTPMMHRTWWFHSAFNCENDRLFDSQDEHVKCLDELRESAIMNNIPDGGTAGLQRSMAGSYSPLLFMPCIVLVAIIGDDVFLLWISRFCNHYHKYLHERHYSILLRALFAFWLAFRVLQTGPADQDNWTLTSMSRTISCVLMILDFIFGDVMGAFNIHKRGVKFEILKRLPGRLYVCREVITWPKDNQRASTDREFSCGAVIGQDIYRDYAVKQRKDIKLLCDVQGMICWLQPITRHDLHALMYCGDVPLPIPVYSTATFNVELQLATDSTARIDAYGKARRRAVK
ncbi:hypothetical protein FOL47_007433 [Perkinsus chesapeaki]|uniref:Uncharacterized protein n=1 Tax=Perkinsus chesapeaki TaxID=330153 RepID=A0A7J6MXN0_PERCH|nr:hypothetical protein FOL47_007433 [Perkinsus chesapeaki]